MCYEAWIPNNNVFDLGMLPKVSCLTNIMNRSEKAVMWEVNVKRCDLEVQQERQMPNLRSTIKNFTQKGTCTLHMLDIQIFGYICYTLLDMQTCWCLWLSNKSKKRGRLWINRQSDAREETSRGWSRHEYRGRSVCVAKKVLTSKGSCSLSKMKKTKSRRTQKRYRLSTANFYSRSFMEMGIRVKEMEYFFHAPNVMVGGG